jgi:hypothetical protein
MSTVLRYEDFEGIEVYVEFERDLQESDDWVRELIDEGNFEIVEFDEDEY